MTTDAPSSGLPAATTMDVQLRTLRERRRRVWRSVLTFVVVTTVLVLLSIANRDESAIRSCHGRMMAARDALQQVYDRGRPVPPQLPLLADVDPKDEHQQQIVHLRSHAYYNVLHDCRLNAAREVGVCACRGNHTRLIGDAGRWVIVFNSARRQYEVRWMDREEFERQADELGLRDPLIR